MPSFKQSTVPTSYSAPPRFVLLAKPLLPNPMTSLHPTNDYKTSVLSGLSPSLILEICGRAIAFWQYQIHQENSYQQALVRSVNDRVAQLQKQLENVVREANSEIGLMNSKISGALSLICMYAPERHCPATERDLENERRRNREYQEALRDKDKEYQKLKNQHDKIKRKALLGPSNNENVPLQGFHSSMNQQQFGDRNHLEPGLTLQTRNYQGGINTLDEVVGGMEAQGANSTDASSTNGELDVWTTRQLAEDQDSTTTTRQPYENWI
ncbi:hypothetical protein SISNIDRAFT_547067 [Sistotremastrum niveocremeum HHB9708]|uniref:Uncharacterized protein n=1 Tax=Sistotremastrum niveocremeum HHB9708 TaxID=1314777 RepID=A0A164ZTT8_9AGAM|nr:hypothetical protein SISNIDRAFT_547067 [Sistotremastrum niveocremeum HHB9708]